MPFEVMRTPQLGAALRGMSARERRAYEAARDALKGEGCKAGGYRLAAVDGEDYPLCCRHLAYAWRVFTAYPDDRRVGSSPSTSTMEGVTALSNATSFPVTVPP